VLCDDDAFAAAWRVVCAADAFVAVADADAPRSCVLRKLFDDVRCNDDDADIDVALVVVFVADFAFDDDVFVRTFTFDTRAGLLAAAAGGGVVVVVVVVFLTMSSLLAGAGIVPSLCRFANVSAMRLLCRVAQCE
jgi:hypothetical protein